MEIIQPIYKKADKLECSNYRAITLLNVTYKVLLGILYNRLAAYAEEILGDYQCGYRVNRPTTDHIFTIRQTQENAYNIHLHNLLTNFKQAFDSVNRGRMLNDLLILRTPKKLVQRISVTMAGSKATVRHDNQYKSTFPRSSKLKIYKSLIRPVVTYKCEAWTLTNRDEQHLRIFESRILSKIFGPVQNEDGSWRIRMNYELNEPIENADIVRFIKSRRIAWLGHVIGVDDKWKPIGTRIRGRPRKRWIADIEKDMQIMGIRRWRNQCKKRAEWKRITEKAKTHSGL
jgi:hypothetical protein